MTPHTPLTPDLATARTRLYANSKRRSRGWHGPAAPDKDNPSMLAAKPVHRAARHAAELARWQAMGTPAAREAVAA